VVFVVGVGEEEDVSEYAFTKNLLITKMIKLPKGNYAVWITCPDKLRQLNILLLLFRIIFIVGAFPV
jgi:hypothetical protein